MRHSVMIAAVLLILLAGYSLAPAQDQNKGKTLYENNCAVCHGTTGKGDGPAARTLASAPSDFATAKFWKGDAGKEIRDAVMNGYGAMPPLDLQADEIKAITDYMTRTFKK